MIFQRKRTRQTRHSRRRERASHKRILFLTIFLLIAASLYSPVALLTFSSPDIDALARENPRSTALIRQRAGEAADQNRPARRDQRWISFDRISRHLRNAVVVSEDATFWTNDGFDLHELRESIKKNWRLKRYARGASTITQQLAKNLYFGTDKSIRRKIAEAVTAWRIDRAISKERILEVYLNVIEWGDGVYGAEAAAQLYFGKSAADLGPREAALMASAIPSPRRSDPGNPSSYLERRADVTLGWMRMRGMIEEAEYRAELRPPSR